MARSARPAPPQPAKKAPRRRTPTVPALTAPPPPPEQRRAQGKALRTTTPRSSHGGWEPSPDRPDPVEVLIEQGRTRLPDLLGLRYARMLTSPFAFLRGSALVMALDLASTPSAGPQVQLCGDAHISNVGVFASPERRLLFDLNDFDETWPGPFEWDLKRMAASTYVAAIDNSFGESAARRSTATMVRSYRTWMERYGEQTVLDAWYASIATDELLPLLSKRARKTTDAALAKARTKTHLRAFDKLTVLEGERRRFVDDPPLLVRLDDDDTTRGAVGSVIAEYRDTLRTDHRMLFDRYRLVDVARKVVGVGSVGTRCHVALMQGPNLGPLFLQVKEANRSSLDLAGLPGTCAHQGQRVVEGQRLMQASSDVLLGWATDGAGRHCFVRQLWDAKGSADVASMAPSGFETYVAACGWALARAHARTGDAVTIAGYLGRSDVFDDAMVDFAAGYAAQTARDHAALRAAADRGAIPLSPLL
jgi:uncharacterized protein (DUF2252 family)